MVTLRGHQFYLDISRKHDLASDDLDLSSRVVEEIQQRISGLRHEEMGALSRLAQVRCEELDADRIRSGLDSADQQALELFARRDRTLTQLLSDIGEVHVRIKDRSLERDGIQRGRNSAQAAHDEQMGQTLDRLEATMRALSLTYS